MLPRAFQYSRGQRMKKRKKKQAITVEDSDETEWEDEQCSFTLWKHPTATTGRIRQTTVVSGVLTGPSRHPQNDQEQAQL